MSTPLQRNGATPRRPGEEDDFCPVCKSSRYLNPDLRFLVNPECYHKMCTSCVDRIFSSGPAPCPVAGCAKTLRKYRFRQQTFGDIKIEREMDLRHKYAGAYNWPESIFDTLLEHNNYLELVEDLTYDILNGIKVAESEAKLAALVVQNAGRNNAISGRELASGEAQPTAQNGTPRHRRTMAKEDDEQERAEGEEGQRELASTNGTADQAVREAQKIEYKKSTARRKPAEKARKAQADSMSAAGAGKGAAAAAAVAAAEPGFQIRGLKPLVEPVREKPYDPFGGISMKREYYEPQEHIDHPWLDKARTDPVITAGGYDLREYYARTLLEAFAGLGCFIAEEMGARDRGGDGSEGGGGGGNEGGGEGGGDGVEPSGG